MDKEQRKEIANLKNQIEKHFTEADWLELEFILHVENIMNEHPRFWNSLKFRNDDYGVNIFEVLTAIVNSDKKNLQELKSFVSDKYATPPVAKFISTAHSESTKRVITFSPQVFTIPTKEQDKKLVAVMLPFTYVLTFSAVRLACDQLNLECKKADDIWDNATFIQNIFELIFTSQIVVADFTGKNANVFYEVGIAHTLGKTVIPITQHIDDIPSDLTHHNVLKYFANKEGYEELANELVKRIGTFTKM